MTLTEQVVTQARIMAHELSEENQALLEAVCRATVVSLTARLREHLTPEDCRSDFVMAAGLYALSAMSGISEIAQLEQFTAGDLTLRRSGADAAAACLHAQAELLMAPYLKDTFAFQGV